MRELSGSIPGGLNTSKKYFERSAFPAGFQCHNARADRRDRSVTIMTTDERTAVSLLIDLTWQNVVRFGLVTDRAPD